MCSSDAMFWRTWGGGLGFIVTSDVRLTMMFVPVCWSVPVHCQLLVMENGELQNIQTLVCV